MPGIVYSGSALADLDRLFDFLATHDPALAGDAAALIADAVTVLARHPYLGRPLRGLLRELVISQGRTGYVTLYRVSVGHDRVEILAIRHQRDAGYGA